jgi:multidrug efflux system membrane fusion protein
MRRNCLRVVACFLLAVGGGCQGEASPRVAPPETPAVPVSRPVQREVTDYLDFTGRTDAVQSVDVRPRVTGYLVKLPFKEGADVKEGDLLFEIDPRPYQAQLDQAKAEVNLNEARVRLAKATYERDRQIAFRERGGVSPQQLDQDRAEQLQAEAALEASRASLNTAQLYLDWTRVTSPINGVVSRYYLTRGNLVNQDQTLLTMVVSLDPMYVYFDMDEPMLLRIRKAINEGRMKRPQDGAMPVLIGLQGEEGFPHRGTINFINNQVNPTTGSITMRGVLPNPRPSGGERLLSPGMFVRVRLPIGQPHPALLVIDRAVSSDQGLKYLYVLDADNKVQYRRVTTGALQPDGLRVIAEGLNPDDWVVGGGLQQIRPRMQVRPDRTTMPSLGPAAVTEPPRPVARSGDCATTAAPGGRATTSPAKTTGK